MPTRLYLIDRRTARAYQARVTWIKAPDFGLTFVNAYSLDVELPPDLQFLNRVWAVFRSPLGNIPDGMEAKGTQDGHWATNDKGPRTGGHLS